MKLTKGQIAALKWLKISNRVLLPHTINGLDIWMKHEPASIQSFISLKNKGLVRTDPDHPFFWELTEDGIKIAKSIDKEPS